MRADPNQAVVGGLVLLWAFGGLVRTYRSIVSSLGRFGTMLHFMSPFKWSMELQVRATSWLIAGFSSTPLTRVLDSLHGQVISEMRTYDTPLWPTNRIFAAYSYDP